MAEWSASPAVKQELCQLRAGLTDSKARHLDTALLLERLSGQNAALRLQLREGREAQPEAGGAESTLRTSRSCPTSRADKENRRELPSPSEKPCTPKKPHAQIPCSGGQVNAGELGLLRHRVWQLERELEVEKRRSAALQKRVDGQEAQLKASEATDVAQLRNELASLRTWAKQVRLEHAAEQATAVAEASSHFLQARMNADKHTVHGETADQLRHELKREVEAARLLHKEELRVATAELSAQHTSNEFKEELAAAEVCRQSCEESRQKAHLEEEELEAISTLLRTEVIQSEKAMHVARMENQVRCQQVKDLRQKEAEEQQEYNSLALDRDRWRVCSASMGENYHREVLAAQLELSAQNQEVSQACAELRSELTAAEAEVNPLRTKLQEVSGENSSLLHEGRSLREQLVESLREASRNGDRLLVSWERCRAASEEVSCLKAELAQAREEAAEVAEALVEEQSQASDLRCRLRKSGLMPALAAEGTPDPREREAVCKSPPLWSPAQDLWPKVPSSPASSWQPPCSPEFLSPKLERNQKRKLLRSRRL
ncbi:unnamed protein product [Symbiodinium sp. CCMP2592]|nr:unnamed protein product [Symbiodinium sp. CCMP2592]